MILLVIGHEISVIQTTLDETMMMEKETDDFETHSDDKYEQTKWRMV